MENFFVTQRDNQNVVIGGVKSLTDFSDEFISVRVNRGTVNVTGEKLKIQRFDENEIEIFGTIGNVETLARPR